MDLEVDRRHLGTVRLVDQPQQVVVERGDLGAQLGGAVDEQSVLPVERECSGLVGGAAAWRRRRA